MMTTIDRRTLLAGTGGGLALALVPAAAWAVLPKPPVARVAPVSETLFGTTVIDNYRWMESDKDPEWLPYIKGQDSATRATLAAIPGRAALLRRVSALSGEATVTTQVQRAGERIFFQ